MESLLETERLILRRLTDDDAYALHAIKLEMAKPNQLPTLDDTRNRWLPNILAYYKEGYGFGYWAAVEKTTDEFIGWFYFRSAPESPTDTAIGYFLQRSAWGKGYATEGAQALIRLGFTKLGVRRIVATALASNKASIRVMEKLGLQFEKRITADALFGEAVGYCLSREDFNDGFESSSNLA